ncbi:MAG TPA: flagellar biosynthetic protein FliO [Bryobacteraceae bacterium]|jgi:flagellar biogenesis protein FliO
MELSQELIAIAIVLGLLWITLKVAHRRGRLRLHLPLRTSAEKNLELIDRLALTAQHSIHSIRFGERVLLIATYPGGVEWLNVNKKSKSSEPSLAAAATAGSDSHRGHFREKQ